MRKGLVGNCIPFGAHFTKLSYHSELFYDLDSTTKSPRPTTSSAPFSKLCEKYIHDLPQTNITKVSGELDDIVYSEDTMKDLSTDQRLLLEYVHGISQGKVNAKFHVRKIAHLYNARWLTLAI